MTEFTQTKFLITAGIIHAQDTLRLIEWYSLILVLFSPSKPQTEHEHMNEKHELNLSII